MCHQITYKLPCEHIRADVVYCADAPIPDTPSPRWSGEESPSYNNNNNNNNKRDQHGIKIKGKDRQQQQQQPPPLTKKRSSKSPPSSRRMPCRNLTMQSIAYPMPPSFEGDPSMAALSPLLPKCPLPRCPFEALNRCWNCCWCGKGWNEQGRCGCVMIIGGNQVRCEHICCETCTTAGAM